MKTGDLIFRRSNHFLSRQIQRFTGNKWSHVAMILVIEGEYFVIEAEKRGIQISYYPTYKKADNQYKIKEPLFHVDDSEVIRKALPCAGKKPYDYFGLLHQALYQTSGKWIGRKGSKASKRLYCSEFVAWVYNSLYGAFPEWYKMSPGALFESKKFI